MLVAQYLLQIIYLFVLYKNNFPHRANDQLVFIIYLRHHNKGNLPLRLLPVGYNDRNIQ